MLATEIVVEAFGPDPGPLGLSVSTGPQPGKPHGSRTPFELGILVPTCLKV